jgi:hypothetical protein
MPHNITVDQETTSPKESLLPSAHKTRNPMFKRYGNFILGHETKRGSLVKGQTLNES